LSQNFAFHFNITGQKFPLQRCAPNGHTTASFAAVKSSNKTRSQEHTFLLTLTKYPVTFL
ncbi:hypothetical protein, partial [Hominenteromicrobium sp.]|uniref:hypothetical protein n=1 Tax=Hominenteromicrobium sp. TaxID=3073581 RepID=UPI003A8FCC3C